MSLFRNDWKHPRVKWQWMTYLSVASCYRRYTVFRTPWLEVFFNRVYSYDPSPLAHTHPWTFLSLILRGSYEEHRRYVGKGREPWVWRLRQRRWSNAIRHTTPHRITKVSKGGFLSLVFALPRKDDFEVGGIE